MMPNVLAGPVSESSGTATLVRDFETPILWTQQVSGMHGRAAREPSHRHGTPSSARFFKSGQWRGEREDATLLSLVVLSLFSLETESVLQRYGVSIEGAGGGHWENLAQFGL
jgi:hypothetical protein